MKIIEPKVELWQQGGDAKIIAGMIRNNLMELGYDFRD